MHLQWLCGVQENLQNLINLSKVSDIWTTWLEKPNIREIIFPIQTTAEVCFNDRDGDH